MNWNSVSDFLNMGGYGLYVWGSYAVTLAAMLLEPWRIGARHRRAREHVSDSNLED
jgi:heme exporter protein D